MAGDDSDDAPLQLAVGWPTRSRGLQYKTSVVACGLPVEAASKTGRRAYILRNSHRPWDFGHWRPGCSEPQANFTRVPPALSLDSAKLLVT